MIMAERHQGADVGFHAGELAMQQRAGVRPAAERLVRMLEPAALSGGIAGFLAQRTFLVITGRGRDGLLWTSPLLGPPGFLEVRSETTLAVHAAIPAGDPLHELAAGQKLGLTTVEFATRRRVRINGILTATAGHRLTIEVEQAYGNCPQYIQQRLLEPARSGRDLAGARHATALAEADAQLIRRADTFFLGTVHPERGADAPHPDSSASPAPAACGGRTTRATTCSTASATWPSIPRPPCSFSTSTTARPCSSPGPRASSGTTLASPETMPAPAAGWSSPSGAWSRGGASASTRSPTPPTPATRR